MFQPGWLRISRAWRARASIFPDKGRLARRSSCPMRWWRRSRDTPSGGASGALLHDHRMVIRRRLLLLRGDQQGEERHGREAQDHQQLEIVDIGDDHRLARDDLVE